MGDFEVDTRLEPIGGNEFKGTLSRDWEIWGPNGGYLAAIALRAVGQVAQVPRPTSFAGHFISVGQFDEIDVRVETLRAGRELRPDDSEFNNNLAFVLAKHLGDLEAALAPAQKAAELTPNDANVLDTLGWIYLKTGQLAQAQALLQQAVERATTPVVSVPANIHLAEVYLINEEFPAARRHIERARTAIRLTPELAEEYQPELDSLIQRLDQAEG